MSYIVPSVFRSDISMDKKIEICNKLKGSAVYQLNILDNNVIYIGASSKTRDRIERHIRELKDNKHHNFKLQASYNSSSTKLIEVSVFVTDNTEQAFHMEKEIINNHRNDENCTNITNSSIPGMLGKHHSEEFKQIMKKKWEDPELKDKRRKNIVNAMKDPGVREISRQGALHQWRNSEYKEQQLQLLNKLNKDPKIKEKRKQDQIKRMENPVNRELSRQAAIKQWNDPEMRKKMSTVNCKKVTINGVTYNSVKEAINLTGISEKTYYKKYGNKKEGVT